MRKLWVDDEREAPGDDWIVARTFDEAVNHILDGVDVVSLDHDLGCYDEDGNERTGYHVAAMIEQRAFIAGPEHIPQVCLVHSANPAGASRIEQALVATCNRSAPKMSIRRVDYEELKNNQGCVDF